MENPYEAHCSPWPTGTPALSVAARLEGPNVLVDVRGEADSDTAEFLRVQLIASLRPGVKSARVDVTELSFCDLRGSDALHAFVDEARSLGIPVDIHGMSALLAQLYVEFAPRRRPTKKSRRPKEESRLTRT